MNSKVGMLLGTTPFHRNMATPVSYTTILFVSLLIHLCTTDFYRQSLQLQKVHAELFHNATALRGINRPEDVQKMSPMQRDLAIRCIKSAVTGLDLTVNSPAYNQGLKYGECTLSL
jgi:hypothetical protein